MQKSSTEILNREERRHMRYLSAIGLLAILAVLAAACGGSTAPVDTPAPTPTSGEQVRAAATATPTAEQPDERLAGEVEGIVFVVGGESEATFTVEEQLARLAVPNDAVMRTSALSGEVRLDGGEFAVEIDLSTLTSDQGFRDRYARTRMFGSDPRAVFAVPDAGELPAGFGDGETVTTSVTGTLTLLGKEFPLSFDIEARDDGHTVFVLGRTQFTWEELEVPVPQVQSVVWIADEVRVEVLLALEPDGVQ
jgi:polyisoprenoid-binding protein YceI